MRGSCRVVVVTLTGVLALIFGINLAAASPQVAFQSRQPAMNTVAITSTGATGETNERSASSSTQSASATDLAPSPPSGTMTYSAWVAVAAFVLGVIGLIIAAVLLRRLKD